MRDTCFICSRNSYDFEHHGKVIPSFIHTFGISLTDSGLVSVSPAWKSNYKRALMLTILLSIHLDIMFFFFFQGFDHHVRFEHNMWSYIFFFIHLHGTKVNDYTALEMFVHKLVRRPYKALFKNILILFQCCILIFYFF